MAKEAKFLAFDLGAESGRGVIGFFDGERLRLEEVNRFANIPVRLLNTLHWNSLGLFAELKQGLAKASSMHGKTISGIGICTWGVDFGLLSKDGALLGNPRHYRDHGNDGGLEVAFRTVPRDEIFDRTGIQFMQINTLYQLLALKNTQPYLLEQAHTLLMMPDLLNYWFTGVKKTEFSIASTSQMIDPRTRNWAKDLLGRFELPTDILTEIVPTGAKIGNLLPGIAAEFNCGLIPVIAPGEHDTASAIVAVPSLTEDYAYLSSGTWSLMGIETNAPLITPETLAANFTNEGGACGTIRLLKNVMGLWLVQECRRGWIREGKEYDYPTLTRLAEEGPPFGSLIEPDHDSFLAPADMPQAIRNFCVETGQTIPVGVGATIRCCLESLALKYRWVLEKLETFRGAPISVIHIVGGGTQNRLLCQLTADATNRTVIAGPVEATAIGNILMQALGTGHINSLAEAREAVRRSFPLETYSPTNSRADWDEAYDRFLKLRDRIGKKD